MKKQPKTLFEFNLKDPKQIEKERKKAEKAKNKKKKEKP